MPCAFGLHGQQRALAPDGFEPFACLGIVALFDAAAGRADVQPGGVEVDVLRFAVGQALAAGLVEQGMASLDQRHPRPC